MNLRTLIRLFAMLRVLLRCRSAVAGAWVARELRGGCVRTHEHVERTAAGTEPGEEEEAGERKRADKLLQIRR